MTNFVVALVIALILGAAILYIRKEKKKGVTCIGCPNAGTCAAAKRAASACGGSCAGCKGCAGHTEA